tara:strand:- start:850 stop:1878 length:1029 start_codon:yes stop_codon:yes gene_type:complete
MLIGVWNHHENLHKNNFMLSESTEAVLGEDSMLPFYEFSVEAERRGHKIEILNEKTEFNNYDIFIFVNFPKRNKKIVNKALNSNKPKYLLNYECPTIFPETWDEANFKYFTKVFTWADNLIDNKFFFKINCPSYPVHKTTNLPNDPKEKFCVTVGSNKRNNHTNDLYWKRLEIIRWFEKTNPQDLDFYGYGWTKHVFKGPLVVRALNRLPFLTKLLAPKFKNYKGEFFGKKQDLLKKYKFSICVENAKYYPGYLTEKIFHCFFSLTVPIYLGSDNITDHIPPECFIDMRKFKNYESLYKYLKEMDEKEYLQYQNSIKNFLSSKKFKPFSLKHYIETLSNNIL